MSELTIWIHVTSALGLLLRVKLFHWTPVSQARLMIEIDVSFVGFLYFQKSSKTFVARTGGDSSKGLPTA